MDGTDASPAVTTKSSGAAGNRSAFRAHCMLRPRDRHAGDPLGAPWRAAQQVAQPQGRAAETIRAAANASRSWPSGAPRTIGDRSQRIRAAQPRRARPV